MGGDHAPAEIVAGARRAAEAGIPVLLVGRPEEIGDAGDLEVLAASEVIGMADDPARSVRRRKDASVVRAAEAVRDGRAAAMVSAGNTGAAMASALLRMGRLPGVARPAVATPIPTAAGTHTVLLDAGANLECTPEHLVQFARMGSVYATHRFGAERPRVGLLTVGEEHTKGTPLVRAAHALLAEVPVLDFIGNVEGRDLMTGIVDVVVTDGFTGNVALKTLEGGLRHAVRALSAVVPPEALELMAPVAAELDPDHPGGAALLGVRGVCVIAHGSSSARAMANAIRLAREMVESGLVAALGAAMREDRAFQGIHP